MTWEQILKLGPTKIARILGCPVSTAGDWINRGGPPAWQRRWFAQAFGAEQAAQSHRTRSLKRG